MLDSLNDTGGLPRDVKLLAAILQQSPSLGSLVNVIMIDGRSQAQTDYTVANALNTVVCMYPPADNILLREWKEASKSDQDAYQFTLKNLEFLQSVQAIAAPLIASTPAEAENTESDPLPHPQLPGNFDLVTWNVRGIHSKAQAISTLIHDRNPLVIALTETHLLPSENHSRTVANIMPGYSLYASSHPQPNLLRNMPSNPIHGNGSVLPTRKGHAGVILAIRSEWAKPHLLQRFSIPKQLEGHLVHICIRMSASKPLHILAVYRSNSAGWKDLHATLIQYISAQLTDARAEDAQVIMGGDWNGVLRPSDRSSGKVTRLDLTFQDSVDALHLTSAFSHFPQAQRTHSYRRANLTGPRTTSRIDDWLLPTGSSLSSAVLQGPQVLTAEWTALSDHRPVILSLPATALFICPPTEPPKPVPRKPVLQRPFQPSDLETWTDTVRSQTGADAAALANEIDSHIPRSPLSDPIPGDVYDLLSTKLTCIMSKCLEIAKAVFNITHDSNQNDTPLQHRSSYLPRALKKPYEHHFKQRQHCRALLRILGKATCIPARILIPELNAHPKVIEFYEALPDAPPIPTSAVLITSELIPKIIALDKHHRRSMKAQLTIQRTKQKKREAQHFRRLLYTCKSKAHKIVFGSGSNNTGTQSMEIAAIQHPFAGIVVDQSRILEGLDFSQRKLNAQSVPAHLASAPPYQQTTGEAHPTTRQPLPDPITIARRGSATTLAPHLTIELFETCLKRL